jgi:hypothetical protein
MMEYRSLARLGTRVRFCWLGIVTLMLTAITGCDEAQKPLVTRDEMPTVPTFSTVRILNQSKEKIDIGQIEGFQNQPPSGKLSAGAKSIATLKPQPFPKKITIHWAKQDGTKQDADMTTTEVRYAEPDKAPTTDSIDLIFGADETWTFGPTTD